MAFLSRSTRERDRVFQTLRERLEDRIVQKRDSQLGNTTGKEDVCALHYLSSPAKYSGRNFSDDHHGFRTKNAYAWDHHRTPLSTEIKKNRVMCLIGSFFPNLCVVSAAQYRTEICCAALNVVWISHSQFHTSKRIARQISVWQFIWISALLPIQAGGGMCALFLWWKLVSEHIRFQVQFWMEMCVMVPQSQHEDVYSCRCMCVCWCWFACIFQGGLEHIHDQLERLTTWLWYHRFKQKW